MSNDEEPILFDQLLDKLEEWYGWIDEQFGRLVRKREKTHGEKVGCFNCPNAEPGCCYQKNMIYLYEALPIVRFIMRGGMDTPEFRAKLREFGDEMEAGDRTEWFHEKHPCVFLEGGKCSIYSVRPMVCRTYYVVTPPELCQPDSPSTEIAHIDNSEALQMALDKAQWIHQALHMKETPMRILMGALPRMVLLGLEIMTHDNYPALIREQIWPSSLTIDDGWVDGNNPFREKLYQIRRSKESTNG